jgi:hypothetical protein
MALSNQTMIELSGLQIDPQQEEARIQQQLSQGIVALNNGAVNNSNLAG